jgi:hypothetical protein
MPKTLEQVRKETEDRSTLDFTNSVSIRLSDDGAIPELIVNGVDIAAKILPGFTLAYDEDLGTYLLNVTFSVEVRS